MLLSREEYFNLLLRKHFLGFQKPLKRRRGEREGGRGIRMRRQERRQRWTEGQKEGEEKGREEKRGGKKKRRERGVGEIAVQP